MNINELREKEPKFGKTLSPFWKVTVVKKVRFLLRMKIPIMP